MSNLFTPYKKFIGSFIPNCLLQCQDITALDKLVWARLAQYAGENGSCFPKQKSIADDLGSNKDTISRSLKRLEDKGFIEVKRPTGKERWAHRGNQYFFIDHEIFDDSIQSLPSRLKVYSNKDTKSLPVKKEENHKEENHKTIPKDLINFVLEFYKIQKNNHPNILKKDLTKNQCMQQATVLSNLTRLDKYDFITEIKPAILWATSDSFWTGNLLSLSSLRTKSKSNNLMKFQNILSKYLEGKPKSKLSPERQKSYVDFMKEED